MFLCRLGYDTVAFGEIARLLILVELLGLGTGVAVHLSLNLLGIRLGRILYLNVAHPLVGGPECLTNTVLTLFLRETRRQAAIVVLDLLLHVTVGFPVDFLCLGITKHNRLELGVFFDDSSQLSHLNYSLLHSIRRNSIL